MAQEGWERGDFPIVCETCLGDNPYVRMIPPGIGQFRCVPCSLDELLPLVSQFTFFALLQSKSEFDQECKVCTRPMTTFRWRAGTTGRFKKTEICQTCSKLKNCCQTCLLDLQYNLPTQVRDAALPDGAVPQTPQSGANREYFTRVNEQKIAAGELPYARAQFNPIVSTLARTTPHYDRNRAHICSFFVKGTCTRGELCPYRHEKPKEDVPEDLAKQNLKDRYYGVNDPVAKRMLSRLNESAAAPPPDESIKTLFVANVDPRITENDLRDHFYYFGEIVSIKILAAQKCAFVEFTTREAAVAAMAKNAKLIVKGVLLKVAWAKPVQKKPAGDRPASADSRQAAIPPPPGAGPSFYPSMDPERLGSRTGGPAPAHPQAFVPAGAPSFVAYQPTGQGAEGEPAPKRQRTD